MWLCFVDVAHGSSLVLSQQLIAPPYVLIPAAHLQFACRLTCLFKVYFGAWCAFPV